MNGGVKHNQHDRGARILKTDHGVKQDGAFNGRSILVVKVENWKEIP
jgi:hypothetical protein